ncbi:AAC(3)-VI family aminoglycoside N-acetyltransferase, partial [Sinorhizobium medicae]
MTQREWRISELVNQLLTLGVKPGGVLVVHSSFRSVRPVEGGPAGM